MPVVRVAVQHVSTRVAGVSCGETQWLQRRGRRSACSVLFFFFSFSFLYEVCHRLDASTCCKSSGRPDTMACTCRRSLAMVCGVTGRLPFSPQTCKMMHNASQLVSGATLHALHAQESTVVKTQFKTPPACNNPVAVPKQSEAPLHLQNYLPQCW